MRDFGTATATDAFCQEGGGYELTVQVLNRFGNPLPDHDVKLGGGPARTVPRWALELGKAPIGPLLDDENVPQGFELNGAAAVLGRTPDALFTK